MFPRKLWLIGAIVVVIALLMGCSGSKAQDGAQRTNPLAGAKFYVNPGSTASKAVEQLANAGRRQDAELILGKIANQPTAVWFTDDSPELETKIQLLVGQAEVAKRLPVLVMYYIPHRDCGLYSAGGAPSAEAYRSWITRIAASIGEQPVVVILEPDALPHIADQCLPPEQADERLALLREAVSSLKKHPGTSVYIDAGNAGWKDPHVMADKLQQAGVDEADGFSVNVANFQATQESVDYGMVISKSLEGMHFVIDTSRNGNGPLSDDPDGLEWCNPPGRALGKSPRSNTGNPLVDAFLWVKQPGESDGACRPGAPPAGQWWTDYALLLAKNTP